MMIYKSCPKCRGDITVERDLYGGQPDLVCLQCGYTARPNERVALLTKLAQRFSRTPQPALAPVRAVRRAS
jgi:hypothetical protein